jgi:hypothetical protein
MMEELAASLAMVTRAPVAEFPAPAPVEFSEVEASLEVTLPPAELPDLVTPMEEEVDGQGAGDADDCTEAEDSSACASFCKKMFRKVPEPLLPRPASSPAVEKQPSRSRTRRRKPLAPTRSSLRQAARPSSVPVAQRAQLKLMRELDFINGGSSASDAAITDYVDSYGQDLPEEAVNAIRSAARLDDMELSKALAAIAADAGTDMVESP